MDASWIRSVYLSGKNVFGLTFNYQKFLHFSLLQFCQLRCDPKHFLPYENVQVCLMKVVMSIVYFFPVVTIYATLGEEAIAHGINETEVSVVITSHDLLPKFRDILSKTPRVKKLIYMEDQLAKTDVSGYKSGVEIIPFSEVVKNGASSDIRKFQNLLRLHSNELPLCLQYYQLTCLIQLRLLKDCSLTLQSVTYLKHII